MLGFPKALSERQRATILILFAVAALVSVAAGLQNAWLHSQDFQWQPSWFLLHGQVPARAYIDWKHGVGPEYPLFLTQYPGGYPTSGEVFLWPLAAMPWPLAKAVWATLNLGFATGIIFLIVRRYLKTLTGGEIALFTCLFLTGTPFRNGLGNGQHALFALFFFLVALDAQDRRRPAIAALALAMSWFKYTLTFPLTVVFISRKRISAIAGAVLIHVCLSLALALWTGASPIDLVIDPLRSLPELTNYGSISTFSLALKFGIESPIAPAAVSILIITAACFVVLWFGQEDELLSLCLMSLVACVVVYHSLYDHVILVFPLAFLFLHFKGQAMSVDSGVKRVTLLLLMALVLASWYLSRLADALPMLLPVPAASYPAIVVLACLTVTFYISVIATATAIVYGVCCSK